MAQKNSPTINFTSKELKDVKTFCDLNELDIDQFVKNCFNKGYNIEKYGLLTNDGNPQVIIEEREVIKEVIKEVPVEVEKIVEKEIIKEIKVEVPIENSKDSNVKEKLQALQKTISNLREDLREKEEKILQLEKSLVDLQKIKVPIKGQFMRSSNIEDNLYR
jgi:hypothetical protein